MRDQILESFSHRDFSIMVIGNKFDLIAETNPHTQVSAQPEGYFYIFNIFRYLPFAGTKRHLNIGAETLALRLRRMFSKVSGISCGQTLNNHLSSGRFNYRVGDAFRELMGCGCGSASGGANSNSGTLYHRIGGSSAGYSSTEPRSRIKGKCNIL